MKLTTLSNWYAPLALLLFPVLTSLAWQKDLLMNDNKFEILEYLEDVMVLG